MKYKDIDNYVKENNLLQKGILKEPGVYAITVDNIIVYVG